MADPTDDQPDDQPDEGAEPSPTSDGESPKQIGGPPPGALGEALGNVMRLMLERGQSRVERAAADGRTRLELRQLRRDRDAMYRKLGREVRLLLEAGEIDHPGIRRGVERITLLDEKLADMGGRKDAVDVGADASDTDPDQ
jgi:hypothetical protein